MEMLPPALPPGTVAGHLKKELQTELKIGADIPVISVGGDQQAAAVGLGVVRAGLMCVNTGTGSFILSHSEKPAFDEQQRVICTASAVAGKWLVEASIFTSGSVYRWFRDNFATVEKQTARELQLDAYDILNSEIKYTKPGAQGVLLVPHFAGSAAPYWDPAAAGLIFGLSLGHKRSDVIRALMEGICFEICKNIRIIENLTDSITEIRVAGGATRSMTFNQMQADIYGKAVLRGISEQSSALGAMIIAATTIGLHADIDAAVAAVIEFDVQNRRIPDVRTQRIYEKMLDLHDTIYQALLSRDVYKKAAEVRQILQNQ